jgi:hypothetical protein
LVIRFTKSYRMIVCRDGPTVRLYSRNAYDWIVRPREAARTAILYSFDLQSPASYRSGHFRAWAGASKVTISASKHSNGTPGKKPPAPSLKVRRIRTPLEQRSGTKPPPPVDSESNELESRRRPKPVSVRRGRG